MPTKSHDLEETGRTAVDRACTNSDKPGSRVAGNTVTFVEEPEVKVFLTRVSSRKWVRLLRKYSHLEIFRESLVLVCAGVPAFVEACCRKGSCFGEPVARKAVGVLWNR